MKNIFNHPDQVIQFMENNDLTSQQICQIIFEGYQVIADEEKTPQVLIQEFRNYVLRYGNTPGEKPLFLNLNIDVE